MIKICKRLWPWTLKCFFSRALSPLLGFIPLLPLPNAYFLPHITNRKFVIRLNGPIVKNRQGYGYEQVVHSVQPDVLS